VALDAMNDLVRRWLRGAASSPRPAPRWPHALRMGRPPTGARDHGQPRIAPVRDNRRDCPLV